MAILHEATVTPAKLDLLAAWLPGRSWFTGPVAAELERVATCRLDDPDGEVGIEVLIVRAGDGPPVHVPLTYRAAPLEGGARFLVGTTRHSVLGERWVYDACGDPVYASVLATTILAGGAQADELVNGVRREPLMTVRGTGTHSAAPAVGRVREVRDGDPTVIATGALHLTVRRVLTGRAAGESPALNAAWAAYSEPVVLATAQATGN